MGLGDELLEAFKAEIAVFGEPLTVTRRPATQGGATTSKTVSFIIKALQVTDSPQLTVEGQVSAQDSEVYLFSCAGDEDVKEAIDTITWLGVDYRLTSGPIRGAAGVSVARQFTGARA